ncbi:hypothetical protein M378DRAFT_579758 [Amanita muscaria Koide BX008]|uniref:Uncharacterized protein n=1 Tax=Amanita muscaria (strain Koide BX008) TaxID=946122 RepID=A0A0C2SN01_AMAMK|nr:hypothetical protein M378DRAFT_579758 [Amanita muscaria Koide BX008]
MCRVQRNSLVERRLWPKSCRDQLNLAPSQLALCGLKDRKGVLTPFHDFHLNAGVLLRALLGRDPCRANLWDFTRYTYRSPGSIYIVCWSSGERNRSMGLWVGLGGDEGTTPIYA